MIFEAINDKLTELSRAHEPAGNLEQAPEVRERIFGIVAGASNTSNP